MVDRIKALGYETDKRLSWACGDAVRDEWLRQEGELPEKALRPKTNSKGTHCFAIYPESFRPVVDALVRRIALEYEAAAASQLSLFDLLTDPPDEHPPC